MECDITYVKLSSHMIFTGYAVYIGSAKPSNRTGTIKRAGFGWAYYQKGITEGRGEIFNTVEEVKASVEGTDDAES